MSISLVGIRAHNNLTQRWFSVYPEKQIIEASIGAAALTVVLGAKNNNPLAIDIKGELLGYDGAVVVGYVANTKPQETHVFEWNLDVDGFTLPLTAKISSTSVPYVGGQINTIPPVSFTMNGIVSLPPPQPEESLPAPQPMPELPSIIPILSDVTNWIFKATFPAVQLATLSSVDFGNILGTVGKALGDTVAKPLEGLPALLTSLNALPSELTSFFGNIVSGLVTGLFQTGSDLMNDRVIDSLKGTPVSVGVLADMLRQSQPIIKDRYEAASNPDNYVNAAMSNEQRFVAVAPQLLECINAVDADLMTHTLVNTASLGQIRVIADRMDVQEKRYGLSSNVNRIYSLRMEKAVFKPLEKYFNEKWLPEIPNTQDLINMVVKEKMSLEDFKKWMSQQGFNPTWSQLIWDAHFKAPDLDDILTAWRRGLIDEKRVDELMILVDLDPAFKQIFDTRKYIDPPMSITRLMFETGAINAELVPTYVHRMGYAPEFEAALVEFILHFQERRYKTRYITQLMTALAQNVATEDEVKAAVKDIGFTTETADLIIKTSLLRRRTYKTADTATTEKALTLGELKKAYVEDIITETQLRNTMLLRGYTLIDINIVIDLLNKDKVVESEGRRVVVLTVAEMVSAWRYSVITEDQLRTNLLGRGLDLNEIDILIKTKKASWGLTGVSD